VRRRIAACLGTALLLGGLAVSAQPPAAPVQPFRVIVHPKNRVSTVSREFLADVYLKKATRWPGDRVIRPVDLGARSAVRHRFSNDVLKRPVEAVRSYWRQIIFSGRGVPPPEFENDEQVISFVLKHEGAIGYVSSGADLHGVGVKIVTVK
jgi:ABC-type phosphate transport system substrate-binding protein